MVERYTERDDGERRHDLYRETHLYTESAPIVEQTGDEQQPRAYGKR